MADLISVNDCPCDGCQAKPCGHPARCVKFAIWLNKSVYAVELPCKIGDRVYAIRNYKGFPSVQEGIVSEMLFTSDMRLQIVVKHICRSEWGRKIFATREEALAKIGGDANDV